MIIIDKNVHTNHKAYRLALKSLGAVSAWVLIAFLGACTSSEDVPAQWDAGSDIPRRSDDIGSSGYRTSVGDALDIFVLEDSGFNGLYIVRPSGDIIIPKAGRIQALGMTLSEVESAVRRSLEANQLTAATVIVDPVRRGAGDGDAVSAGITIYLSGNVAKTGRVFIPFVGGGQVSAFQAVMDSGGFGSFANKKKSYILRKDGAGQTARIGLDFTKIEKGEIPDVPLQDADMLVVPQKLIGF
mgnify:CR=1 FL=1